MDFDVLRNNLGISPTVGVILMVAITVVLAVTVGFVVLDLGDSTSQNARAGVNMEETNNGVQVTVNSMGGNTEQLQVLVNGEPVKNATLTTAGDSVTVTAGEGDTVLVRGTTSTGSSSTMQSLTTNSNTLGDESEPTVTESNTDSSRDSGGPGDSLSGPISSSQSEPSDLTAVYNSMETNADGDYIINNSQQLQAMSQDSSANYVLGQNIDAGNTSNWNDNSGFNPIGSFSGSLDGNGYAVTGLMINRSSENKVGLFGSVQSGSVSNIGLVNATISGNREVGGLVGNQTEYGSVSNSYVIGTVSGSGNGVGGLVGYQTTDGSISNSYMAGEVSGSEWVGGLAGYNNDGGSVRDSYMTGNVTGYSSVGGLVGYQTASGSVDGASELFSNATKMQGSAAESNMNFDWTNIWSAGDTGEYPQLQSSESSS